MTTSRTLSPIIRIAQYTIADELRRKSFAVMFFTCALLVFLVRGCYQGSYVVNGQMLDAETVVRTVSNVLFQIITAVVMLITALLAMRALKRDRDEGVQSCILSKPIARWQYVTGKICGLWALAMLFLFLLHGIVFVMTSLHLQAVRPEYLLASLLSSVNLLFVIVAVLLLSMMMPGMVAFLSVLGIGVASLVFDGMSAFNHSQLAQTMIQQPGAPSPASLTGWQTVSLVWPKLAGMQQLAASLLTSKSFAGFGSPYPLINVLLYCLIFTALLFWRFRHENLV